MRFEHILSLYINGLVPGHLDANENDSQRSAGDAIKKLMIPMGYKLRVYTANKNDSQRSRGRRIFYRYISMG